MAARRILLVIDEMEVGGSQRQIAHLLAGLDRSRWQPELAFFRSPSFLIDEIKASGIPVHHIAKRRRLDPRFFFGLIRLLRRRDYALVHAYSLTAELWCVLALRALRRRPALVASVRGLYASESPMFWRLKKFVLRRSSAIISNSRAGVAIASARTGVPPQRFDVVGNGLPTPAALSPAQVAHLRGALTLPPARPVAIFVGRLVAVKNIPLLLAALARLPAAQRPFTLLVGDGPERARLAQSIDALQLAADVRLLGQRSDATDLIQLADFLVLPSISEGLSNVILEAKFCARAVLASAVGGNVEAIADGIDGLLFTSDDCAALAERLHRLTSDDELRTRLGRSARLSVERAHSLATLADATARVYARCLQGVTGSQHLVSRERNPA